MDNLYQRLLEHALLELQNITDPDEYVRVMEDIKALRERIEQINNG